MTAAPIPAADAADVAVWASEAAEAWARRDPATLRDLAARIQSSSPAGWQTATAHWLATAVAYRAEVAAQGADLALTVPAGGEATAARMAGLFALIDAGNDQAVADQLAGLHATDPTGHWQLFQAAFQLAGQIALVRAADPGPARLLAAPTTYRNTVGLYAVRCPCGTIIDDLPSPAAALTAFSAHTATCSWTTREGTR